eukprot:TRINITY_DN785_c1_g1_i11.p1 TRINITY_DN785_c1_g1~~TRINITY_DN785_c1_g1_i11.p1  ORF type:complete len:238 (-),score=-15.39 TRINITY_DN785_c1_g1_i11:557-1270(-)
MANSFINQNLNQICLLLKYNRYYVILSINSQESKPFTPNLTFLIEFHEQLMFSLIFKMSEFFHIFQSKNCNAKKCQHFALGNYDKHQQNTSIVLQSYDKHKQNINNNKFSIICCQHLDCKHSMMNIAIGVVQNITVVYNCKIIKNQQQILKGYFFGTKYQKVNSIIAVIVIIFQNLKKLFNHCLKITSIQNTYGYHLMKQLLYALNDCKHQIIIIFKQKKQQYQAIFLNLPTRQYFK